MTHNLELMNIRIDIDDNEPEVCWLFMMEGNVAVEGGRFNTAELMNHILEFYNREY